MKRLCSALLAAALALSLLAACGHSSGGPGEEPAGSTQETDISQEEGTAAALGSLKSFTAGTLDGKTFTQEDIQARDVTIVNFWALTCPPCIAEMPDLAAFARALPDNVQVITVCLDGFGNEELVREVMSTAEFQGVTLISGDGDLGALCGNLMYTPTTVLADAEGNLAGDAIIGGQRDLSETLLTAVNQVLKGAGKDEISLEGA